MAFVPVPLVSPDGRPWTAHTATELTNLRCRGYRPADAEAAAVEPEQPVVHLVPPDATGDQIETDPPPSGELPPAA